MSLGNLRYVPHYAVYCPHVPCFLGYLVNLCKMVIPLHSP